MFIWHLVNSLPCCCHSSISSVDPPCSRQLSRGCCTAGLFCPRIQSDEMFKFRLKTYQSVLDGLCAYSRLYLFMCCVSTTVFFKFFLNFSCLCYNPVSWVLKLGDLYLPLCLADVKQEQSANKHSEMQFEMQAHNSLLLSFTGRTWM